MTTLIFKSKRKIAITDYVDYPVLHTTITYTGIFFRNFSVALDASLGELSSKVINFTWKNNVPKLCLTNIYIDLFINISQKSVSQKGLYTEQTLLLAL